MTATITESDTEVIDLTEFEFDIPCERSFCRSDSGPAAWIIVFRDPLPCGCTIPCQAWCDPCLQQVKGCTLCHHPCKVHGMAWDACVARVEPISRRPSDG